MTEQHGNTGKRNAAKEVTKLSFIQIRCTQAEKALIVRNLEKGEKLSEFMLSAASEKIERRLNESYSEINPDDLRVFSWGVNVINGFSHSVPKGVHIIHLPTGIEVKEDSERSQHQNKHIAMERLIRELNEKKK